MKGSSLEAGERILVTGSAGFIGYHLIMELNRQGRLVIGMDNMNDYYDVTLKRWRNRNLEARAGYTFIQGDIANAGEISDIFSTYKPGIVINLAAQAGVRYSIDHPRAYLESNMIGFFNILEECRRNQVKHLIYASSSSVYGNQDKVPFSVGDMTDCPVSFYAATKKSNELMAYSYSHIHHIPTTGLRFFTVYGPAGRPDMAYYSFTDKILAGEAIQLYNQGNMYRDFTYVDDAVSCITAMLDRPPRGTDPAKIYNIGNSSPVSINHFVKVLENALSLAYKQEIRAKIEYLPMQPGDVFRTYADVSDLADDFSIKPETTLEFGLNEFARWYRQHYGESVV